MAEYQIAGTKADYNIILLDTQLKANPNYTGYVARGDDVYLLLSNDTQAIRNAIDVIVSVHDNNALTEEQTRNQLQNLTRDEVLAFFRQSLIDANGSGSALIAMYNQARTYQANNNALDATMRSLQTIHETANGLTVNLNTNAGKATYLQQFIVALGLWI